MDLTTRTAPEGVTFTLQGRFDAHEAPAFRGATAPHAERGLTLAIDLSAVAFIDSTALAELVHVSRVATQAGGSVRIVDPSSPVTVILQLSGLVHALTVEYTAPQAG